MAKIHVLSGGGTDINWSAAERLTQLDAFATQYAAELVAMCINQHRLFGITRA